MCWKCEWGIACGMIKIELRSKMVLDLGRGSLSFRVNGLI